MSQAQTVVLAGGSKRYTKRLMKSMVETGKIERIGGWRYGYWKGKEKSGN